MQPQKAPTLEELLNQERHLEALQYIVDRVWPLQREGSLQLGANGILVEIPSIVSTAHLQLFLMTAANSRLGDITIRLLDSESNSKIPANLFESSPEPKFFSNSFRFKKSPGNPRSCALFNSLCLVADTLIREPNNRGQRVRNLPEGKAEKTLARLLTSPQIDFPHLNTNNKILLYCNDFQNLSSGERAAWIEFKVSPDRSAITLTFFQHPHSVDFDPYLPSICIREPFFGGSAYSSGKVQQALKVLFAADALFPNS